MSAVFSADRRYRYRLEREVTLLGRGSLLFIGLNPSVAGESEDDPTIRREIGFTEALGFRRLIKVNLFALVSTDPKGLLASDAPISEASDHARNDREMFGAAAGASMVIAAWGAQGGAVGRLVKKRATEVLALLGTMPLYTLKVTAEGHPSHPLYLKGDAKPVRWWPR